MAKTLVTHKHWRNDPKKTTRYHTHTTGWYLHGPRAGAPRPGGKTAMLRACTTLAFDEFKHPSRKSGKQVIDVFKDLRRQRGYNTYL